MESQARIEHTLLLVHIDTHTHTHTQVLLMHVNIVRLYLFAFRFRCFCYCCCFLCFYWKQCESIMHCCKALSEIPSADKHFTSFCTVSHSVAWIRHIRANAFA